MAYCDNCGAYIPDGQTKCLACGYDENAAKAAEAAAAAAQKKEERQQPRSSSFDSEQLRRQLEQQREKQRENSRKWAEAERARRQQQEESQRRANSYSGYGTGTNGYNPAQRSSGIYEGNESSRRMGIISYIGALWILPFIFRRDDRFAMYHAKQGLVLSIAGAVATAAASILNLGWVVTLARLYMIYKGISNAYNGRMEPLPYIGDIVSKL